MTKFKLEKGEEVQINYANVLVYANDLEYYLDVFVTNKRLILLTDANKEIDYVNMFRGRGQAIPAEYEMALDLKLEEIKDIVYKDEYNHITFENKDDVLDIYCDDLTSYLKRNVK